MFRYLNFDSVFITKIVGVTSIIAIMISVFLSPILSIMMFLFIVIPLAFYGRYKINEEEKYIKKNLRNMQAQISFKGKCYEGFEKLDNQKEAIIYFKGKEIIIFQDEEKKLIIPKNKIKKVEILTLAQIKEIASTNRYISLGKLGKVIYENKDNRLRNKKSSRDKHSRYLIIRFITNNNKIKCISFFESKEYQYENKLALGNQNIEKFSGENYHV